MPELRVSLPAYAFESIDMCYPSGLKIQALQRSGAAVVTVSTVIGGGTAGEDPAARGASHLVEHLWFESRPDGAATVSDVLSALPYQGITTTDANVYVTTAAGKDLQALLNIEAIRLLRPLAGVDAEAVDREKAVVHAELQMRGAHVYDPLRTTLEPALWGELPEWAGQRTGTAAEADALTLEQLQAYAERWYRPENTTIRIEGAVDPRGLERIVAQTFPPSLLGGPGGDCRRPLGTTDPPDPASTALVEVTAPVEQPTLVFAWTVPAGFDRDDLAGSAAAFWLAASLRYDLSLVRKMDEDDIHLACAYDPGRQAGVLTCSTPLSRGADPEKARREVATSLSSSWGRELVPANILWLVRKVSAFDRELARADSLSVGALVDRALASHFRPDGLDPFAQSDELLALTAEELQPWARRWLTEERMVSVILRPGLPPNPEPARFAAEAMLEAPAPAGWSAPVPSFADWKRSELPNGVDLWVLPSPGARGSPTSISWSRTAPPTARPASPTPTTCSPSPGSRAPR
jgi:predicted Zn-dependent peptidase